MNQYPAPSDLQPGWHTDPSGRFDVRYWNGSHWTDSVSSGGQASVDPGEAWLSPSSAAQQGASQWGTPAPGAAWAPPQWGSTVPTPAPAWGAPGGVSGPPPIHYQYGGVGSTDGWIAELGRPAASKNKRFLAAVIDFVVGIAFYYGLTFTLGFAMLGSDFGSGGVLTGEDLGSILVASIAFSAIQALLWAAYVCIPTVAFGGSPGKRAMGIRIMRLDGQEVTYATALARFSLNFLWIVPLGNIGLFFALIANLVMISTDDKRRSIYDRIAGTAVVAD